MRQSRIGRLDEAAKARSMAAKVSHKARCLYLVTDSERFFLLCVQGRAQHETLTLVSSHSHARITQRISGWCDPEGRFPFLFS